MALRRCEHCRACEPHPTSHRRFATSLQGQSTCTDCGHTTTASLASVFTAEQDVIEQVDVLTALDRVSGR